MTKRKMMMAEDERRDAEEAERDMARKRAVMGAAAVAVHAPPSELLLSEAMSAKQRMIDKRLVMKVRKHLQTHAVLQYSTKR